VLELCFYVPVTDVRKEDDTVYSVSWLLIAEPAC